MILVSGIHLPLSYTSDALHTAVAQALHIRTQDVASCSVYKRSIDARKKTAVSFVITAAANLHVPEKRVESLPCVSRAPVVDISVPRMPRPTHRPIVVGSGPAGLFAALILARAGLCPLVLERGQSVDQRRLTVDAFRKTGVLHPNSNIQFGEGGAGTFSDGKLNTGIKDPRIRYVLEEFVKAGAPQDILVNAKPHIGTDRLVDTVRGLRQRIQHLGGEFRFDTALTDVRVVDGAVRSVTVGAGEEIACDRLILAIGHSARDTVEMLYNRGVPMVQKPFAVGVRIEHPRDMIDTCQYGAFAGHPALGAADYKLSTHLPDGRGVFSFCMCPGGVVVPAASEEGGVCVNGMSEYARDAENSNSALLVGVNTADFGGESPLAGFALQRRMERAAFRSGGGTYAAPIQLAGDFLHDRVSCTLGDVTPSYTPGVAFADLRECLPPFVVDALKQALPRFGRQIHGFDRPDAVLTGVEARSSSPVRLLRDDNGATTIAGLYPCGEGAGYAGGITSAAVDGIRTAQAVIASLQA